MSLRNLCLDFATCERVDHEAMQVDKCIFLVMHSWPCTAQHGTLYAAHRSIEWLS